jgi:hypothetical protein
MESKIQSFKALLTYDTLKAMYLKKGHRFYDKGDYNVNVFGVRLATSTDEWDDIIGIAYRENGVPKLKVYKGTTDPGTFYLKELLNKKGCAILVPGQYPSSHAIGPHGKKAYDALRQKGKLKVYRDGNLDKVHDMDVSTIDEGDSFFINVHHGYDADKVGKNSAGCQVIRSRKDFKEFMSICHMASATRGNSFTYTLFDLNSISL